MWRFFLAFRCFFLVLFARRLPADAIQLLPAAHETAGETAAPEQPTPSPAPARELTAAKEKAISDGGALRLLAILQREGRLVDFLLESIDGVGDAKLGVAARDIHRGCHKALAEYLTLEPVMPQPEESIVRVEPGFDASAVRLVGEVVGAPPFSGVLRHAGWRASAVRLPAAIDQHDPTVLAPAEVELGAPAAGGSAI